MARYTILLTPDSEDGGYVVTAPALEGCITEGDSLEEAIQNAREAIEGYIESLTAHGETVPAEIAPPQLLTIEVDTPTTVAS